MGYESSAERWSPVQSVEKILLSVVSMLAGKDVTKATSTAKDYHQFKIIKALGSSWVSQQCWQIHSICLAKVFPDL